LPPPLISNVNAKAVKTVATVKRINDYLPDKLAADKNFQEFVFFTCDFISRIESKSTVDLLAKYFSKTLLANEESQLFANLNLENSNNLNNYFRVGFSNSVKFRNAFPELNKIKNFEEVILEAARNVISTRKIILRPLTCWEQFLLLLSNCNIGCYGQPEDECFWPCYNAATGWFSFCNLIEEL